MAPVEYFNFRKVLLLLCLGLLLFTSIVVCTNSEAQSQIQSQAKQFVSRRLLEKVKDEEEDPKPKKKSTTNLSSSSSSLKNQTKLIKPKTKTNSTKTTTTTSSSTQLTKIQLKKLNSTSKSSNSTKSTSILTKKSSDLLKSSTSKIKTTNSISSKDTKSLLEKKPTEPKSKSLEKSEDSDKKPTTKKAQKTEEVELNDEEEETQLVKKTKSKSKSSELKSNIPEKLQITEQKPKQQKTQKQPNSSTEREEEEKTEKKPKPQTKSKSNEVKPKTPNKNQIEPKKTEEKKTQKPKQPEWLEQSEDHDLVAEFRDLPYKFHQTILPDLQRISTSSKLYLTKANKEITKGFKPWVGNKYAPTVASITCAAFVLIPLALVSLLFSKFKAYFSLQKVLIVIQVYLSIYFSILCLSSVVTGLEPLRFFYATSQSTYVWIQVLQTLAYVLYLLLLLMYLVVAFSNESGLGSKALGLAQIFVGFSIGLHYYVSVFHRAVLHQPPKTNWKIHGIYATCFLMICLFATAERRKKAYLQDGGEEGKKS